jgi:hypothetical protein
MAIKINNNNSNLVAYLLLNPHLINHNKKIAINKYKRTPIYKLKGIKKLYKNKISHLILILAMPFLISRLNKYLKTKINKHKQKKKKSIIKIIIMIIFNKKIYYKTFLKKVKKIKKRILLNKIIRPIILNRAKDF